MNRAWPEARNATASATPSRGTIRGITDIALAHVLAGPRAQGRRCLRVDSSNSSLPRPACTRLAVRRFVEHAEAAAEAQQTDAVVLGSYTAQRQLQGWRWSALHNLPLALTTWVVRRSDTCRSVRSVKTVLAERAKPSADSQP